MPPKAKVIIFQDDSRLAQLMREDLETCQHTVTGSASNMKELTSLLRTTPEANVALIDNTAPWKNGGDCETVGYIAEDAIRGIYGKTIITVAATSNKHPNYGEHRFDTGQGIFQKLGEFVTRLPRKEF